MPTQPEIDPLAQLDRDLRDLQRAPAQPTWDPGSVDSMVDWLEKETGLVVRRVPKIHAIVRSVIESLQRRERLRLAILGPRGGGKTKLAASIELMAYRWYGYSWQNVGGSLEQAKLCYSYVKAAHAGSADLQKFTISTQEHDTRSRKGDSIAVSAASQTSVRGPHPVGSSGGGGLTLDESAIIPDEICDAAKGQLMSASPSALIQLSTMGERQVGRFWELLQDPAKLGYRLETFDVFDVAKRCPFDCKTTCPVKEHFAEDFYSGAGDAKTLVHKAWPTAWFSRREAQRSRRRPPASASTRRGLKRTAAATGLRSLLTETAWCSPARPRTSSSATRMDAPTPSSTIAQRASANG